jgi:uncharacterized protein YjbI with pentapeptide repeats
MTGFEEFLKRRLFAPGVKLEQLRSVAAFLGIGLGKNRTKAQLIACLLQSWKLIEAQPQCLACLPPDPQDALQEAEAQRKAAEKAQLEAQKENAVRPLREALDTSTKVNRTLGLSFVALLFYILIIVASTTDLQLFLPESTVRLPLLDVELPLLAFYIVVPFIILIFHFHLLINLKHHQDKYRQWRNAVGRNGHSTRLDPILINFVDTYPRWHPLRILLVGVTSVSIFYFPLVDIILLQWRFGDYHNFWISTAQFGVMILDAVLIIGFYRLIFLPRTITALTVKKRIFVWGNLPVAVASCGGGFMWLLAFKLGLMLHDPHAMGWIPDHWLPRIDLTHYSHKVGHVADGYVMNYLRDSLTEADAKTRAKLNFGEPLNLQGRDFRFGVLDNINLARANLKYCRLGSVSLHKAHLEKADMKNANLAFAYLESADLEGANLYGANMIGATLEKANLEGAVLNVVHLEGANLVGANLRQATMESTYLGSSKMENAHLESAFMRYANLSGASMEHAHLEEANLQYAQLEGACLNDAHLEGSDFSGARLIGTDLKGAYLAGANFGTVFLKKNLREFTNLMGADLSNAHLEGADFRRAILAGAELSNANFEGAALSGANLAGTDLSMSNLLGVECKRACIAGTSLRTTQMAAGVFSENDWNCCGVDWLACLRYWAHMMPTHEHRQKFRERILAAQKRCIALKSQTPACAGFSDEERLEVLSKIASHNKFIAMGILKQLASEPEKQSQFIALLCVSCPETIQELDWNWICSPSDIPCLNSTPYSNTTSR